MQDPSLTTIKKIHSSHRIGTIPSPSAPTDVIPIFTWTKRWQPFGASDRHTCLVVTEWLMNYIDVLIRPTFHTYSLISYWYLYSGKAGGWLSTIPKVSHMHIHVFYMVLKMCNITTSKLYKCMQWNIDNYDKQTVQFGVIHNASVFVGR